MNKNLFILTVLLSSVTVSVYAGEKEKKEAQTRQYYKIHYGVNLPGERVKASQEFKPVSAKAAAQFFGLSQKDAQELIVPQTFEVGDGKGPWHYEINDRFYAAFSGFQG